MKPLKKRLNMLESYGEKQSKHAYAKSLGVQPYRQELSKELDRTIKAIFNGNKKDLSSEKLLQMTTAQCEE